jgi:predicted nuclease of predicted toxin-antitoxin system
LRFLVDRCAGRRLAKWLRGQGHDVLEVRALGRDPGDAALLRLAADEQRILITIDTDFGAMIHVRAQAHAGLIRLPDASAPRRIELMARSLPIIRTTSCRAPSSQSRATGSEFRAAGSLYCGRAAPAEDGDRGREASARPADAEFRVACPSACTADTRALRPRDLTDRWSTLS